MTKQISEIWDWLRELRRAEANDPTFPRFPCLPCAQACELLGIGGAVKPAFPMRINTTRKRVWIIALGTWDGAPTVDCGTLAISSQKKKKKAF